jgi:hypothetical protein
MKRISERAKAENIYKSYQKQEKPLPSTKSKAKAQSGTSKKIAGTMESNASKKKPSQKKKAKEDEDSEDDGGGVATKEEEQGHEMAPIRKRMDVQVTAKSSYGPIQEMPMPNVQERLLELSIDDAIGTLRTVCECAVCSRLLICKWLTSSLFHYEL